jgi:hypothetical protein
LTLNPSSLFTPICHVPAEGKYSQASTNMEKLLPSVAEKPLSPGKFPTIIPGNSCFG